MKHRVVTLAGLFLFAAICAVAARSQTRADAAGAEARRLYQQGLASLAGNRPEDWLSAEGHFRRAVAKDPKFAPAHAGLAEAYINLEGPNVIHPAEAFTKAKAAAEEAVRLDPKLAEGRSALGWVKFLRDRDWGGAEKELKLAVRLKPSDAPIRRRHAEYLAARGRFDEALAEIRRARELDPRSPAASRDAGRILYFARRYDEAIAQYRETLRRFPGYSSARFWLGLAYLQASRAEEAVAEFEQRVAASNRITGAVLSLAHAYAAAGRRDAARELIEEVIERGKSAHLSGYQSGSAYTRYQMATVYAALGEKEQALKNLEEAVESRDKWVVWLELDPRFDALRAEPRFREILRRAGHAP